VLTTSAWGRCVSGACAKAGQGRAAGEGRWFCSRWWSGTCPAGDTDVGRAGGDGVRAIDEMPRAESGEAGSRARGEREDERWSVLDGRDAAMLRLG